MLKVQVEVYSMEGNTYKVVNLLSIHVTFANETVGSQNIL